MGGAVRRRRPDGDPGRPSPSAYLSGALPSAGEALHGLEQLLGLRLGRRRVARPQRVADAVIHVAVEDAQADLLQRRRDGADLVEDVDAVAVLLDHALDSA